MTRRRVAVSLPPSRLRNRRGNGARLSSCFHFPQGSASNLPRHCSLTYQRKERKYRKRVDLVNQSEYSAYLISLRCLLAIAYKWKYIINIAGSELPLYSVDELSDRLTQNNVTIATDSFYDATMKDRQKYQYGRKW